MVLDLLEKYKSIKMNPNVNIPLHKIKKNIVPCIPLHVYMTSPTKNLPPLMMANFHELCNKNKEFTFHLYDDNDCILFLKHHFPEEVLNAFHSLQPGAYKADLWRLCILYKYGGIYMDNKLQCVGRFKLYDIVNKEHFVLDRPTTSLHIYNAFMVSKANNPFLKHAILQIVENVKNKYYGEWFLSPTGPEMLGRIAKKYPLNIDMIYPFHYGDHIMFEKHLILRNYKGYRNEQNKYQVHYSDYWYKKNVYL
jgi:mannosyltransferase OCH1-like enzyme